MAGTALALLVLAASAHGATITVNSIADDLSDDGDCTLREAITSANTNNHVPATAGECADGETLPTVDTIAFAITGAGPQVITPATALPTLSQTVAIDGDFGGNSDEIELDGSSLPSGTPVLSTGGGIDDIRIDLLAVYGTSGTNTAGIAIVNSEDTIIENSFIGTDAAGTASIGNSGAGVSIGSFSDRTVVRDSVLSGNGGFGVFVQGSLVEDTVIEGNKIGTNPAGTAALGNGGGVGVSNGPQGTVIGGPLAADGNLISGNAGAVGIRLATTILQTNPIAGTMIQNNRIGPREDGNGSLPTASNSTGIELGGIVNTTTIDDNQISDNTSGGIVMFEGNEGLNGPSDTVIIGNLIGTDSDGDALLPNGSTGIRISGSTTDPSTGNRIGGTSGLTSGGPCTGGCNVIAGGTIGVQLDGDPALGDIVDTEILGNHIGTNAAGTANFGATGSGIQAQEAQTTTIGSPAAPNVISASDGAGIVLDDTEDSTIESNLIGTGANGSTALGNGDYGIAVDNTAVRDVIGGAGPSEGNTLANNASGGVLVQGNSAEIAILGNSIHSNGDADEGNGSELGIDLDVTESSGDGVTINDPDDPDTGPNFLQNFPVLTSAVSQTSSTIAGTLNTDGIDGTEYRIEFFASATADPSGNGEGQRFLGATTVTTDPNGDASFNATVSGTAATGDVVTSTATRIDTGFEHTSEFSDAIAAVVIDPPDPPPTPPAPDIAAPVITLAGKKTQKSSSKVKVKVSCDEDCSVEGPGTIKVPKVTGSAASVAGKKKFKLKKATAELQAGETVTLTLKLKSKAKKQLKKALKKGEKSTAKVTVTATDSAGNDDSAKRKVKVKK